MVAMWFLLGLFFAAAAATAAASELECPRAASAAGSQCGRAADADQASDDVAMLSIGHRSLRAEFGTGGCGCVAKEPTTEASTKASTTSGILGCKQTENTHCEICDHCWVGLKCRACCATPLEIPSECRQASNPEQAATGTVDYNSIVNVLPSLSSAPVPPRNGFMATGCVGNQYLYPDGGFQGNSLEFRSLFFTGYDSCVSAQGFYFRAPPNSGRGGCIKYGDDVVIAQTADGAKNQCGWYGCRVAGMQDMPPGNVAHAAMVFDHGGDAPMSFYLQPPVGSGRSGCIQKGDDVVIAQTPNIAKTGNCGWYGCRVATTNTESGYMSLVFDHGDEAPTTFTLTAASRPEKV